MSWLYQPLLLLIARSVQSDLAHQIQYLKAENAILASASRSARG